MKIKKGDILVIIICALIGALSFLPPFLFKDKSSPAYAVIEADGKEVKRISLKDNADVEINGVKIIVEDGCAWVEHSDCPDKTCVKTGKISKTGQRAVCLPNRVMVYIEGGRGYDTVAG